MNENEKLTKLEDDLETLASVLRLKILYLLLNSPMLSVSDLAEQLRVKHGNISQHLQRLENRGFLTSHKDGSYVRWIVNGSRLTNILLELQFLFSTGGTDATTSVS